MSDLDKLLARFETGVLLRPRPDVPNLVDLSRALAHLAGAPGIELTASARKLVELIGACDHLVFILADGLGMNLIEALPSTSFLATHLVAELRTVFPSTTAVALTTLATGAWPSQHGITGQWTHLPEIRNAGAVLPFTTRAGGHSLTTLGVTVEQAFPLASTMCAMRRDTLAVLPENVADSIFSAYFCGQRARCGYGTLAEAMRIVLARVRAAESPTYTYLYTPRIDLEVHRYGVDGPGAQAALQALDHALEHLATELGGRARIVLTADHGLLDTPVGARHLIRPTADLFDVLLFPPSGDARVMYLHLRDGAGDRLRRSFKERYGERFLLISIDEAEQLELFGPGPLSPQTRSRVGDLIAIASGADVIEYAPSWGTARLLSIASHHSGLTPTEMRIPLVLA